MAKPPNDSGLYCPFWRKPCVKVCHTCELWQHVIGKNPQTGADMDQWACAFRMSTWLSIETTQAQRQTTASVDRLRHEVHQANDSAVATALAGVNAQLRKSMEADATSSARKAIGLHDGTNKMIEAN